jgi:hypothetical protein
MVISIDIYSVIGTCFGNYFFYHFSGAVYLVSVRSHWCHFYHVLPLKMSYHQLVIAGNSNVARFLPVVKAAKKDGELQATELVRAMNKIQLKEQLSMPKGASEHLIVAALTNIITSHVYRDSKTLTAFCERVFSEVMTWIEAGQANMPGSNENVGFVFC